MQLVGQKVYFKDERTKQHIIGEIIAINDNMMKIKWLMILEKKNTNISKEDDYYLGDLDKKIQRITFTNLTAGRQFGSRASHIYNQCVYIANFEHTMMKDFELRTNLYAENASKEGYAVWFICNSNLFETGGSTHWKNTISDDWNEIREDWIKKSYPMDLSNSTRIIFIKNKFGKYEFAGVYETTKIDTVERYKLYTRISKVYP